VSYRISAGRSIQILVDTREMVTDTLWVMSMGIMQVSRDASSVVQSSMALELIDSLDGLAKVVDFTELRCVTTFLRASPIPATIIVNRRSTTIHQVEHIVLSFDRFLYDSLPSASNLPQFHILLPIFIFTCTRFEFTHPFPPYLCHTHEQSFHI
jgi:hypothetical protein